MRGAQQTRVGLCSQNPYTDEQDKFFAELIL